MTFVRALNAVSLITTPSRKITTGLDISCLTTGRSHNVGEVLDLSYSPSNPNSIALLQEQKRFLFSVLEQKVLTSDGIVFIRAHSTHTEVLGSVPALSVDASL